jgi:hypothetical protein
MANLPRLLQKYPKHVITTHPLLPTYQENELGKRLMEWVKSYKYSVDSIDPRQLYNPSSAVISSEPNSNLVLDQHQTLLQVQDKFQQLQDMLLAIQEKSQQGHSSNQKLQHCLITMATTFYATHSRFFSRPEVQVKVNNFCSLCH